MSIGWLILLSFAAMSSVFVAVFAVARRMNNFGIVDIAWSYAFGGLILLAAPLAAGWAPRRWLLVALVLPWSLRLGTHLYRRVMAHHPQEDRRYAELRQRWSNSLGPRMLAFFQLQALSVVLLSTPFFLSLNDHQPGFRFLEWIAVAVWFCAIVGEATADAQLAAFKRRSSGSNQVCRIGLWRYSRHPNYFFEWLVWIAYALFAFNAPWGWLGLLAPAGMLYLLLAVTGIPPTEEQAVRRKGAAYRRYQATTSAFFPWFPKTARSPATAKTTE